MWDMGIGHIGYKLLLVLNLMLFILQFHFLRSPARLVSFIEFLSCPDNSTRSAHLLRPKHDLLLLAVTSWYCTFWRRRRAIRRNRKKKKPRDIIITIIVGRISFSTREETHRAPRVETDCESFCVFGFISFQYLPITDRKILKTNYVYGRHTPPT